MGTILIPVCEKMQQHLTRGEAAGNLLFQPARPIPASQLLADRDRVQIEYRGQIYTLSQTRNGKLILTK